MNSGWVGYGPFRSPAEMGPAALSPEHKGEAARTRQSGRASYELLIRPDGVRAAEIALFAEALRKRWGTEGDEGPQILLASFSAWESMEATLIRWIQRVCSETPCFQLGLRNFGGQPPSTICLRIPDISPLDKLTGRLRVIEDYVDGGQGQKVRWTRRPQLSLGGPLAERDYLEAVNAHAGLEYHADLRVHRMMLRKTESTGKARVVNIFPFHP